MQRGGGSTRMEGKETHNRLSINDLLHEEGEDDNVDSIEQERVDFQSEWEDDDDDEVGHDQPKGDTVVKVRAPVVATASSSYSGRHSTLLKAINEQENIRPDDIQTSK